MTLWSYLNKQTEIKNKKIVSEAKEKNDKGLYTEEEMKSYIKRNLKHTISVKTVQRCISSDPRIQRNGRKYFIPQKARFESRYLEPEYFGREMVHEILGRRQTPSTLEKKVKHFVTRFGMYLFFNFIEAVRPFVDNSLSIREKEDLVGYWARTAVPLDYMFQLFEGTFDNRTRLELRNHDLKTPPSEMKEDRIKELSAAMRKVFPEIYQDLREARKQALGKTIKEVNGVIEDMIDDSSY